MTRKTVKNIKAGVSYFFLVLVTIVVMFPVFVMLTRSLMTSDEVSTLPVVIFPSKLSLEGFDLALHFENFWLYTGNTFILVICNCIFIPLSASLCAFGFAKLKFVGKEFWFFLALCTTMLPTVVTQISLYVMYDRLNWLNTLLPLTIPGLFGGGAMNIFLIRQYMRGIPDSIQEAAEIDGAHWFRFFVEFMIPLCRPVIILVVVQTFMAVWNDFMSPLIYLSSAPEKRTLGVGIYIKFLSDDGGRFPANLKMALGVLMVIPPVILFSFFQKELVEGVALSGLKL